MSAQQCFALCLDCWEFGYGISDSNGVFTRDSGSSNHWDCAVHVFGQPDQYPAPIKNILVCLQAGLPVSDGRIDMFSLACAVHAIQPNNGRTVKQSLTVADTEVLKEERQPDTKQQQLFAD